MSPSDYPTEAEMARAFYRQSPMTALDAWVRCSCGGSCGVDIPVSLRWKDTPSPEIVDWPSQCPDSKVALHHPPSVSAEDLRRAWYEAVNAAVTEGMVEGFDCFDPRD